MRVKDLTGQRYGRLVVLYRSDNKTRKIVHWHCQCDCGNECDVARNNLRSGCTTSCGCYAKEQTSIRSRKSGEIVAINGIYANYKRSASSRGFEFNLSIDDVFRFVRQDCYYCGIVPSNQWHYSNGSSPHEPYFYNGIDRVDNTLGYTLDNCVTCCVRCNYAKADMSQKQFLEWVKSIYIRPLFRKTSEKTIGFLIDEFISTNVKCFFAQEDLFKADKENDLSAAAEAAMKTQRLNARRNELMRSIDNALGWEDTTVTEKTYAGK